MVTRKMILVLFVIHEAGRRCRPRNIPRRKHNWKIRSACQKLFTRRVTALEFPPGSTNLVCSADKKGHIGVWDFEEVLPLSHLSCLCLANLCVFIHMARPTR